MIWQLNTGDLVRSRRPGPRAGRHPRQVGQTGGNDTRACGPGAVRRPVPGGRHGSCHGLRGPLSGAGRLLGGSRPGACGSGTRDLGACGPGGRDRRGTPSRGALPAGRAARADGGRPGALSRRGRPVVPAPGRDSPEGRRRVADREPVPRADERAQFPQSTTGGYSKRRRLLLSDSRSELRLRARDPGTRRRARGAAPAHHRRLGAAAPRRAGRGAAAADARTRPTFRPAI